MEKKDFNNQIAWAIECLKDAMIYKDNIEIHLEGAKNHIKTAEEIIKEI